ncbi:MAG TPA: ribosome biogenesis GTPase Der [Candidatus Polarisedimenticolaceae bacterium]|nr:ribosome biogenesis GTPase Der [Candidatus Polarisedimenticolaceae bacterium]
MRPLVAIVGAPNVGKSTLFNRLVGGRPSIVTDEPGVTRDRLYGEVRRARRAFRLVDTGGLTPNTAAPFAEEIERQAGIAVDEAACLLLVVDGRGGLTATDRDVASRLRRRGLPILLVANKIDDPAVERLALELFELGLGEPLPVSAEHGLGIAELLERIDAVLGPGDTIEDAEDDGSGPPIQVALVGRPNVGKSSLLNRLAGEPRALVSEVPGTTRDAVDTILEFAERRFRLIDTAGIRRPSRVRLRAERFSVVRARHNIDRSDVVVLLLDATDEFAAQDAHIAGYVADAFKPLIVAVNKWDLVGEREQAAKRMTADARQRLRFAKEAPIVLVSAKTGQRVTRLLETAARLHALGGSEIPTAEVNRWLQQVSGGLGEGAPGSIRFFYATQTGTRPLTFLVFCNDPTRVHFSIRRRMENTLRERFSLGGVPIRLRFRARRGQ